MNAESGAPWSCNRWAGFAVLLLALLWGGTAGAQPAGIRGTVLYRAGRMPAAGARVELESVRGLSLCTQSDSAGRFRFEAVTTDACAVLVCAAGMGCERIVGIFWTDSAVVDLTVVLAPEQPLVRRPAFLVPAREEEGAGGPPHRCGLALDRACLPVRRPEFQDTGSGTRIPGAGLE